VPPCLTFGHAVITG